MVIRDQVSLNMNVRGLEKSPTISINERSQALKREGKTIYRLGLGQSPFPIPLKVVEALRENAHEKDYLPAEGLPMLREAVANFHRRKNGAASTAECVLIGPGSKELMFLLQLAYYGELIVPTPCWVSYIPQANILGRKVILIPTGFRDRWKMNAEMLEQYCAEEEDDFRPRILILNYPANPDGCTYDEQELKNLAEVARKYRVVLLSDEIYGELHHQGRHISVARYYPEGTIISSGLSKWCGAGGWRLGTFTFPRTMHWLMHAMASLASETYTSVSAPIQYAAIRAFKGGITIERYLWHVRRILASVGNRSAKILSEAGIRVLSPEGGFYLFADLTSIADRLGAKGIKTGRQLCERLLQDAGVAVLPGEAFGRPKDEFTMRIAYVDFDGAKALTASERIPLDQSLPENFADIWCGNVLKAIQLISAWSKE